MGGDKCLHCKFTLRLSVRGFWEGGLVVLNSLLEVCLWAGLEFLSRQMLSVIRNCQRCSW